MAENYIEDSIINKTKISKMISGSICDQPQPSTSNFHPAELPSTSKQDTNTLELSIESPVSPSLIVSTFPEINSAEAAYIQEIETSGIPEHSEPHQ